MSRSYTSSPPKRLQGVERDCFTFSAYHIFLDFFLTFQQKLNLEMGTMCLMCRHKSDTNTETIKFRQNVDLNKYQVSLEVVRATNMKTAIFWDVALCSPVDIY
jgi:hypothetical protein